MRKSIIFIALFVSTTLPALSQPIQTTEITEDVLVVHGGGGNITAVRTDDGIVVVDSFISPEAATEARTLIEKHFPDATIRYLVNTHHHSDHVGGNQTFKDVAIIGHRNLERGMMRDRAGARTESEQHVPTPPTVQISSTTTIKLGGKTFEILHFGTGHTDSDLVIVDRQDKLLILGDLLFVRKCYIMNPGSDVKNWIATLDKLMVRSDQYQYVVPGHGAVVTDASALKQLQDYLVNLWKAVTDAHRKGLTLEEAKQEIRLEEYAEYEDYDRLALDVEVCWRQIIARR